MSGQDMRDFMKRLNEDVSVTDADLKQYFDKGGKITKLRPGRARGITKTGHIVGKGNTGHLSKGTYGMSSNQRKNARTNDRALQRIANEEIGLAEQINEIVMADLNNPYELIIQLEETDEKDNLVRVLADKHITFIKEELIDTHQTFYFDTEATLKQANKAIEAWGWKTNLSEKKKRKGKALSTMGGVDSQGRHSNKIGGDYRVPKNTGVSANPGFFGEDVELEEGTFPLFDDDGRIINKYVFSVTNEFPIFKLVGRAKSNSYYGSAQITSGVFQKDIAHPGDQIHFMHQTMYIVTESSIHQMRLSPPPGGAFERDNSYPDLALKGLVDKGMLTMVDPSAAWPANYNVDDTLEQYPDYTSGVLEDDVEYEPRVSGLSQRLEDMYYIGDDDVEEDYIEKPDGKHDADYIEDLSPEDNEVEEGPSTLFHKMLKKTKKSRREI